MSGEFEKSPTDVEHHHRVEESLLRNIETALNRGKIFSYGPMALVGLMTLLGAFTVLFAGLPFVTREQQQAERRVNDEKFNHLVEAQTATNAQISTLAKSITDLTLTVQKVVDREEEDRQRLGVLPNPGTR